MIENHPFGYYLPTQASKLIIGSFPCFNGEGYGEWFYSGSGKSEFWKLLSDTYHHPADTRVDKERLCQLHGIAITDIASVIRRTKGNCSDANLEILEFNTDAIQSCLQAGINQVYFTSKFVEKHFKRQFPEYNLPSSVLLSPSPAANVYIAGLKEYKALKETQQVFTPYQYRLLKYRQALLPDGH